MKVPKKKFFYGAPSTEGDISPRELTDVRPLQAQIKIIASHVAEAWDGDEIDRATRMLRQAYNALIRFEVLDNAHRERVLEATEK